jgi:hypothetical protein
MTVFNKAVAVTSFAMTASLQLFFTLRLKICHIVGYFSFPGSYPSPFNVEGIVVLGFSSYRKVVREECLWGREEITGQGKVFIYWAVAHYCHVCSTSNYLRFLSLCT